MAKKEQAKMSKSEIIDKVIKTVEYAIAPVTAILAIWSVDAGVYVASGAGVIVSILTFVKLFVK
ncbi:MAG: hypothetical protein J6R99_02870 [Alphaproteobacteria bacterium]|nr:hypothetical protein [Alphaproteobacteria bacterium]MBO7066571.1 hypothetical protein [Alphaproteobacteria bacterium]